MKFGELKPTQVFDGRNGITWMRLVVNPSPWNVVRLDTGDLASFNENEPVENARKLEY